MYIYILYLVFLSARGTDLNTSGWWGLARKMIICFMYKLHIARGTNLITSGWWGLARKINYTGDWLFGLSWSLFTGFGSILTYFYPIYFAILLVHRAWRDDIL